MSTDLPKPRFELARVYDDGSRETEIVPVTALPWETRMDRRGFLGTGVTVSALLGMAAATSLAGCRASDQESEVSVESQPECPWETAHAGAIRYLAFHPDGTALYSWGTDLQRRTWSTGGLLLDNMSAQGTSPVMAANPEGAVVATANGGPAISLPNTPAWGVTRTLTGHTGPIRTLALSADGKMLASAGQDRTICFWALPIGRFVGRMQVAAEVVDALAISPGEKMVAWGSGREVHLAEMPGGQILHTLELATGTVDALALSPDGRLLAAAGQDAEIHLWRLPEGHLERLFGGHPDTVSALAFSPDGEMLASGGLSGVIRIQPLRKDEPATCVSGPKAYRPERRIAERPFERPAPEPFKPELPGFEPEVPRSGTYCQCNKVCVCIPVCQAHRVLDEDPEVRIMAEEILLVMGSRELTYMRWAAERAAPPLRRRIGEIAAAIEAGAGPHPERWPGIASCAARLDDPDEVVALMAAQMLRLQQIERSSSLAEPLRVRVDGILDEARRRPWFARS